METIFPSFYSIPGSMTRSVRSGVGLMGKKGLILSFASLCILLWTLLPPCTQAQASRQKLGLFVRQGTFEAKIKVAADDVLNAIAAGRDIDIEHAVIDGDLDNGGLDIGKVKGRMERDRSGMNCPPTSWTVL